MIHPGERPHRGIQGVRHAERHPGPGRRERLRQEAGQPFPEPAQGPARARPHQGSLRAVPRNRVCSLPAKHNLSSCILLASAGCFNMLHARMFVFSTYCPANWTTAYDLSVRRLFLFFGRGTLYDAATTAYGQVCAPFHSWAIRKAVGAGMYTLPTREQLILRLNETGKQMIASIGIPAFFPDDLLLILPTCTNSVYLQIALCRRR